MYLCKWVGLPYADCTWETAESLSEFQNKIDQFLDREASQYLPKCGQKKCLGYGKMRAFAKQQLAHEIRESPVE
jgi:hypothetical protein